MFVIFFGVDCKRQLVIKYDVASNINQKDIRIIMDKYFTYVLRCADGTLYCGYTDDLEKRLKAHNSGTGAKYTKSRLPVKIAYYEGFASKSEAMRREYAIKQLTRAEKLKLIEG